ncbi:STM3941 family protein [Clostridium sp.]|uniref:STM3941 family protein n=1 Tax=Clostridium sp. TaxID=1506 RepID=UPI003216AB7F
MNEVIVKEDKKKGIKLLILGFIMMIVSIYVLIIGITEIKIIYSIIGTISTIFFGICFIFLIVSILDNNPILLIGEDGITDRSTASSVGFIAWQEIRSIYVQKSFNQKFIGISIYDLNNFMKRISPIKRIIIKINLMLNYAPLSISLDTADMEFNDVLSLLQKRLEEYRARNIHF